MINQLWHFIQPEQIVTILVALSAFATVLTIAAPYLQGDRLRTRMKSVASERDPVGIGRMLRRLTHERTFERADHQVIPSGDQRRFVRIRSSLDGEVDHCHDARSCIRRTEDCVRQPDQLPTAELELALHGNNVLLVSE